MSLQVVELADASAALERAGAFLNANPVQHNLLLTILDQSIELSLGGTFWIVVDGTEVVGFALESPTGMGAVLAPMAAPLCRLLAESIKIPLWRAVGEAGTAAAFAGRYTECNNTAVESIEPQRLYELTNLRPVARTRGSLRLAGPADQETLTVWARAFVDELHLVPVNAAEEIHHRIAEQRFWVWDDDGAVSMAAASRAMAGVARVQYVYTPPELRGFGYATACVEQMSRALVTREQRCVLYTDLGDPIANAIYRKIGYEAVAEILGYIFA